MNKVYFGRYIPAKSSIHSYNPLLKLLLSMLFIILIGTISSLTVLILSLIIILVISNISKIKSKVLLQSIKPFYFLLIFTFLIQLFFTKSGQFGFSLNNLKYAAIYSVRFLDIILISSLLTLTTKPFDFVKIIYLILKPFKKLKLNTDEVAISSIIALRFIPLLFEETEKIRIAQKLRGEENKGLKSILNIDNFLIPLFNRIFYYCEQISITLLYQRNWDKILRVEKPSNKEIITFLLLAILVFTGIIYV